MRGALTTNWLSTTVGRALNHHLSRFEIASAKRIYQHLSGSGKKLSKRLADAHRKRVTVRALSYISSKIDVILLTKLKSQSPTTTGQEMTTLDSLQQLIPSGNRSTEATECDQPKSLGQH
jgi:hypothetical protein